MPEPDKTYAHNIMLDTLMDRDISKSLMDSADNFMVKELDGTNDINKRIDALEQLCEQRLDAMEQKIDKMIAQLGLPSDNKVLQIKTLEGLFNLTGVAQ